MREIRAHAGAAEVLVEGLSRKSSTELSGHSPENRVVNFPGDPAWIGRIVPVRIVEARMHSLRGEPLATAS